MRKGTTCTHMQCGNVARIYRIIDSGALITSACLTHLVLYKHTVHNCTPSFIIAELLLKFGMWYVCIGTHGLAVSQEVTGYPLTC